MCGKVDLVWGVEGGRCEGRSAPFAHITHNKLDDLAINNSSYYFALGSGGKMYGPTTVGVIFLLIFMILQLLGSSISPWGS